MDNKNNTRNTHYISFKELPPELSSLFIKRTSLNLISILIMITCCIFIKLKEVWLISLFICVILILINICFYIQISRGNIYILEAVCEKITFSSFKLYHLYNPETKVELLLKNNEYYYTLAVSKHLAKNLTEGMKLRVYLSKNNAYQKSEHQVVIINSILVTPLL